MALKINLIITRSDFQINIQNFISQGSGLLLELENETTNISEYNEWRSIVLEFLMRSFDAKNTHQNSYYGRFESVDSRSKPTGSSRKPEPPFQKTTRCLKAGLRELETIRKQSEYFNIKLNMTDIGRAKYQISDFQPGDMIASKLNPDNKYMVIDVNEGHKELKCKGKDEDNPVTFQSIEIVKQEDIEE
jgi:hypothetical protein